MDNVFGSADSFTLAAIVCLVLWTLVENVVHAFGLRQPTVANRELRSSVWIVVSFGGVAAFAAFDAVQFHWTTGEAPELVRAAGLVVFVAGVVLRLIVRLHLGKQFSGFVQTSESHTLVTTGIYRYVRHPAYSGTLLMYLGFPSALGSIGGFGLAIVLGVPALIYRIRVEEQALILWFGEEYAAYQNRTWRLIPRVW